MTGTELTAEQIEEAKKKVEEEARSSQNEEKVISPTSTSTQKDQLTEAQKLKIFDLQTKTVRDQGAKITQVQRELDELKAQKKEEDKPTVEESAKKFYADPVAVMREELQKAIAPLNKFKDRFESDNEYDGIKKRLKVNPAFSEHLSNPQFEAAVDALIADGQKTGIKLSDDIVIATIKHTIGDVVTGELVLDSIKTEDKTKKNEEERNEMILSSTLSGKTKVLESIFQKHKTKPVSIRFLKDVEEIVTVDSEKYGPFKSEDIATIPNKDAQEFITKNLAVKIHLDN